MKKVSLHSLAKTWIMAAVAALIVPAASAEADSSGPACAQVLIFGLRGRGDSFRSTPMGADVQVVATKISAKLRGLGYSSLLEGVDYEAGAGAVWDTKAIAQETIKGARYLQDQVSRRGRECDHAKLVVVGQSEGAGVAHVAMQHLAGRVSAVVLLGDPLHEPGQSYNRLPGMHSGHGMLWSTLSSSIPAGAYSRLGSYCLPNDYVCGNGFYLPWNHAHEEYRDDRDGVASAAASFATSIVDGELRQEQRRQQQQQQQQWPQPGAVFATIGSGLRIHTGPGVAFSLARRRAYGPSGTPIRILCQTVGSRVAGSEIWDETPDGWVSDWFVSSPGKGTFTPGVPRCP